MIENDLVINNLWLAREVKATDIYMEHNSFIKKADSSNKSCLDM